MQPAARELFGAPVVKMLNVSGYQCRNRNGASGPAGKTSEHAFANAIDVGAFELANGRRVDVGTDWGPTERDLLEARAAKSAAADTPPGTGPQRPPAAAATGEQRRSRSAAKEGAARTARADRADAADRSGSAATGSAGGERAGTPTTTAPAS